MLVLNYSAILPHTGDRSCWPQIPIARGDVPWVRAKQQELNAMLAEQRWVEPYVPVNAAAPLHPNVGA